MRDEGFRRAMNKASPTAEQKERMRMALASRLPQEEQFRYRGRPEKVKRLSWLPAVAAMLAVAIGGGLALMKGTLPASRKPDAITVESTTEETTRQMTANRPSDLKVLMDSPEYQGRKLMESSNSELLKDFAEKHGLTVEGEGTDTDGWELANQLGIRKDSDSYIDYAVTGGRYYETSGSSSYDGTTTMEGTDWNAPISYRVCFNAWGTVMPELPVLEEYYAYNQWTYTAPNGAILILAQGRDSGVIYGIVDEGFYVVYTEDIRIGDIAGGERSMEREEFQVFAETFWFPVNAYQTTLAGETQYAKVLAQYKEVMEGGSGGWDREIAAVIRARGEDAFGYTFWDLDGDGCKEMLMTDGTYLYGVYTGVGVTAGPVLQDHGEKCYFICEDGTILLRKEDAFQVCRMEKGNRLVTVEVLNAQSDPTAPWLRFTESGTTVLTEEEYKQVRDSYHYIVLPFTPLSSWQGYKSYVQEQLLGTVETPYEAVLENYRAVVALDWTLARCSEEDISLGFAVAEDPVNTIGHCLQDLDGDGEEELIITDGSILYGVYTLENGKAKPIMLSGERYHYYLCEDGYLYSEGSGGAAVTYYEFIRLEEKRMFTAESLMTNYDLDPEEPWFRLSTGTDDTVTPITEEEFNQALSAHGGIRKDLPFTPLSEH